MSDDYKPLDPRQLVVLKETRNQRLAICEQCSNYKHKFCSICKCLMPAKTWLKNENCPIEKW